LRDFYRILALQFNFSANPLEMASPMMISGGA